MSLMVSAEQTWCFPFAWNCVVNPATEWISYSLNSIFCCNFVFLEIYFLLLSFVLFQIVASVQLWCTFFRVVLLPHWNTKLTMFCFYMTCFQLLSFDGFSLNVTENKCTTATVKKTAHYTLRCEQLNIMWYIKVIYPQLLFF